MESTLEECKQACTDDENCEFLALGNELTKFSGKCNLYLSKCTEWDAKTPDIDWTTKFTYYIKNSPDVPDEPAIETPIMRGEDEN